MPGWVMYDLVNFKGTKGSALVGHKPKRGSYPRDYCIFCSQFAVHILITQYTVSLSDGTQDLLWFLMLNNCILKFSVSQTRARSLSDAK